MLRAPGRKRQNRDNNGGRTALTHREAPLGSFYRKPNAPQDPNPPISSDESLHWPPGVSLPIPNTSTPHRPLQQHPQFSVPTHTDSESEDDNMSLQSTPKAILASQEAMQNQLEHILDRVDTLERSAKENTSLSSSCSSSDDQRRKRRLPSDLCAKVATIYQSLAVEDQFALEERANSQRNMEVREKIKQELTMADKENLFSPLDVETAIKRYFESRKRLHMEAKPEQRARVYQQEKQRKNRSRRQRLFDRRRRCVRGSEHSWWDQLSIDYMSCESSDDDGNIVVHHLPWRSSKLNDFLKVLDKRADEQREKTKHHAAERKPRQEGCDALCDPPVNPPKWAVHKDWRKGGEGEVQQEELVVASFEDN